MKDNGVWKFTYLNFVTVVVLTIIQQQYHIHVMGATLPEAGRATLVFLTHSIVIIMVWKILFLFAKWFIKGFKKGISDEMAKDKPMEDK